MKATLSIEDDEYYAMIPNSGTILIQPNERLSQYKNGDMIEVELIQKGIATYATVINPVFETNEDDMVDFILGVALKIEAGETYGKNIIELRKEIREKYLK